MTQEKIEFYKPRDFADRLGVAFKFLRMNFAVMYKNMLWVIIPAAVIQAYFMKDSLNMNMAVGASDYVGMVTKFGGVLVISGIVGAMLYSLTACMIKAYGDGTLNKTTRISDLKDFPRYAIKTALLSLCLGILVGGIAFLLVIAATASSFMGVLVVVLVFILLFVVLAFMPSLSLIFFPIYYEDMNIKDSFFKGFKMGFQHWGTTFLMLMLLGVILGVIQYVLYIPYYAWTFAKLLLFPDSTHWYDAVVTFVTNLIAYLGSYLIIPAMIVGMTFQYFGIREKDEHISVQSQLDEFENL